MNVLETRGSYAGRTPNRAGRLVAAVAAVVCLLIAAPAARAEFSIVPGTFVSDTYDPDTRMTFTQAGGHPTEAVTAFEFTMADSSNVSASVRDIDVELPRGFVGNPQATPKCSRPSFDALLGNVGVAACPVSSQVGSAFITVPAFGATTTAHVPVYNLEPGPDQVADFGIPVLTVPVHMVAAVNSAGDYRLRIKLTKISQGLPIIATRLILWGVPASPRFDDRRACNGGAYVTGGCSVGADPKPFLTNPTDCSAGPATTNIAVDSWAEPGVWKYDSYTSPTGVTGCESLRFEPTISVRSDSPRAGTPAGYTVEIDVPQNDDPDGIATPALRDAIVRMPLGTAITPPSADGLQACTDAQYGYKSDAPIACPGASQVATAELTTPLLGEPMRGEVFLGQPQPGNLFRLFMVLRGPGLLFKLPGVAKPDPVTGQITATFLENPPLPFSNLRLVFKSGPRAPLVNPTTCGPATTNASLSGWGVGAVQASSTFQITQAPDGTPCKPQTFAPSFRAGVLNPVAGSSSTFSLTFGRGDNDQTLRDIAVDMPEGLTGKIALADLCSAALANAGACGASSQIGTTTTGAGQGPNPFYLPGRVYLTESYKGAPFGMSIVVPAIAGPFDLGTVVVRAAVHVDRRSAKLRVVSDPLPTILEGVPLQVRRVTVRVDKPGFMIAPTSCAPKSIAGVIASTAGALANVSTRFQVGSCGDLGYRPRMTFKIGDRRHVRGGTTAPFTAELRMGSKQTNNKTIDVILPDNVNSRLAALRGACSVEDARARTCGRAAVVGRAVALTPLLRDPLRGPVYIVRTPGNRLPNLWVALKGEGVGSGVEIDLLGRVRITRGSLRLQTTFDDIPDVPVSLFRMSLVAGRQGPIGLIRGICSRTVRRGMRADLQMRSHSGRLIVRSQPMAISGCRGRATRRPARRAAKTGAKR